MNDIDGRFRESLDISRKRKEYHKVLITPLALVDQYATPP
jgi:hypothetical protein